MGGPMTKMNITFSLGDWVSNQALKFFSQKPPYWLNERKNQFWGHIFLHISRSIGTIVFKKKNGVHSREFHDNRFKIATCIVTVIIIISWKSRNVIFKCKLKNVLEVLPLRSILIWKKILWRINSVLIKFSIKALFLEKSWNECKNPSFLHKAMCIESD